MYRYSYVECLIKKGYRWGGSDFETPKIAPYFDLWGKDLCAIHRVERVASLHADRGGLRRTYHRDRQEDNTNQQYSLQHE